MSIFEGYASFTVNMVPTANKTTSSHSKILLYTRFILNIQVEMTQWMV